VKFYFELSNFSEVLKLSKLRQCRRRRREEEEEEDGDDDRKRVTGAELIPSA